MQIIFKLCNIQIAGIFISESKSATCMDSNILELMLADEVVLHSEGSHMTSQNKHHGGPVWC